MDPITVINAAVLADKLLGETCPKCGKSSWWKQEDAGTTFFGGHPKVKCGHCGKIFVVKK